MNVPNLTKVMLSVFLASTTISLPYAAANYCGGGSCGNNYRGNWYCSSPRHRRRNRYNYNWGCRESGMSSPIFDTMSDILFYMPQYFNSYVRKIQEQHNERQEEMETRKYKKELNENQQLNYGESSSSNSLKRTSGIVEAESRYSEEKGVSETQFGDGSMELELELPQGTTAKDLAVEIDENDNTIRVKGIHKVHNRQKNYSGEKLDSSIFTRTRLGTTIESKFEHIFQVDGNLDITKLKVTLTSSGLLRILVPKREKKFAKRKFEIVTEEIVPEDVKNGDDAKSTNTNSSENSKGKNKDEKKSTETIIEKLTGKKRDDYDFVIFDNNDL